MACNCTKAFLKEEAGGNMVMAKKLARSDATTMAEIVKGLKEEILRRLHKCTWRRMARTMAMQLRCLIQLNYGIRDKMSAKELLDRVGLVKTEKMGVDYRKWRCYAQPKAPVEEDD